MKLLDIADTAVKIGLGACIGTVGAILLATVQRRHDSQKDLFRRKSDLLEKITEDFEDEHALWLQWYGLHCAAIKAQQRGEPVTEVISVPFNEVETKMLQRGTILHRLEGRLKLLGLGDCAAAVAEYREGNATIHALSRSNCTVTEFVGEGTKRLAQRDRVHAELSKAYLRWQ